MRELFIIDCEVVGGRLLVVGSGTLVVGGCLLVVGSGLSIEGRCLLLAAKLSGVVYSWLGVVY